MKLLIWSPPAADLELLRALYGGDTHSALTYAMVALTAIGGGWTLLALVPLFFRPRWRRFALTLTVVAVALSATVDLSKYATGRTRPWIALGLHSIIHLPTDGSMPSGHAAGSFLVATYLSVLLLARAPANPGPLRVASRSSALACAAGLVVLASGISLSRVYLGAHWPTDIVAGGLLGTSAGALAALVYLRCKGYRILARRFLVKGGEIDHKHSVRQGTISTSTALLCSQCGVS